MCPTSPLAGSVVPHTRASPRHSSAVPLACLYIGASIGAHALHAVSVPLARHLPRSTPLREAYSLTSGHYVGLAAWVSPAAARSLLVFEGVRPPLPHSIFLHAFRSRFTLSHVSHPQRYAQVLHGAAPS